MKFKNIKKVNAKNIKLDKGNFKESFSNKTKREIIENILKDITKLEEKDFIYILLGIYLTRDIDLNNINFNVLKNKKIRAFYTKIYRNILDKENLEKSIKKILKNELSENAMNRRTNETKVEKNNLKYKYVLASMFLSTGYLQDPNVQYNLEILNYTKKIENNIYIKNVFKLLDLEFNEYKDEKIEKYYIRKGDNIVNVLAVMGANVSYLKFEETRVIKYENQKYNRTINFEMSNMKKTMQAAKRQKDAIEKIRKNNIKLTEKLEEVANVRLNNMDHTLNELADKLKISRSTLNLRLKEIEKIAEDIK